MRSRRAVRQRRDLADMTRLLVGTQLGDALDRRQQEAVGADERRSGFMAAGRARSGSRC